LWSPRPLLFSCFMVAFAASVLAFVTPVMSKTSIAGHHA
jgi:hypothetical protein